MHIIDPYRHSIGGITGVYWSHFGSTGCPDPKNTGHTNQIYYIGNPIEGWNQSNTNYDYDWYPNYKWIDSNGTIRQNTAPAGVSVYFDYRTDSSGDSDPLQKCYLTGSWCDGATDSTGCLIDEYTEGGNNFGLPTTYGSLSMATDGTGGSSTQESFIALSQSSPWINRYFFVQHRIRITDASGATMASDWTGRVHVNVQNRITEYENNAWSSPSWDSGGTCPSTYVIETGACSPNPAEDCHIVNDDLGVLTGSDVVDDWVIFDIDGNGTDYYCGQLLTDYAADMMWWPDNSGSDIYMWIGDGTCYDCQQSLP